MKKLLAALLLSLALIAPAHSEVVAYAEDASFRLELTDEPCTHTAVLERLSAEAAPLFSEFRFYVKSQRMLQETGGQAVVRGCYSGSAEVAPYGFLIWVNEFGGYGYQSLGDFTPAKKGVSI